MKIADFFCIHVTIRHTDPYRIFILPYCRNHTPVPVSLTFFLFPFLFLFLPGSSLQPIHTGITLRLCQMNRHRLRQSGDVPVGAFDLIHSKTFRLRNNAISSSFYYNVVSDGLRFPDAVYITQRYFCFVFSSHPPLNHSMNPSAFHHCSICGNCPAIVDIATPQKKFYQITH